MRWMRWGLDFANILMFVAFLVLITAEGAKLITRGAWEYKDLIAILLSVVSIIITFIGIMIAIVAVWGFQALKGMAEEKAIETSKIGSSAYLESDAFKADLKSHIQQAIQISAREAVQDALAPVILSADSSPEHQVKDEQWRD